MSNSHFDGLIQALVDGDDLGAAKIVKEMLAKGVSATDILAKGCGPGMLKAGERFASGLGGASLTDLLLSGEAMKAALEVIKPHLKSDKTEATGKYLLGQIEGDIHTIGRDVVRTMLQSAGWDVLDLGEDIPVEKFIEVAKQIRPDIIGAASAITGSLNKLQELKQRIDAENIQAKFMIGGWSTGPEFAKSIGAYFARDAVEAVKIAANLVGAKVAR
jgi:methanogenic corrinoid protein MtbC1